MCDFIDAMKICQLELCQLYSDPFNKFDDLSFDELNGLENFTTKNMPMN
jgi:hypothetical protein